MAKTLSKMVPLLTKASDFSLWEPLTNSKKTLSQLKGEKATVIMFICNHCPFVIHIRKKLIEVVNEYQKKGISFIGINSNDTISYPDDSPEKMIECCEKYHYSFPYLFDENQQIARDYDATCTPDFFLYDKDLLLIYRGRFDSSNPGNSDAVTGRELINALESVLNQGTEILNQRPSIGCNIKWRTHQNITSSSQILK